MAEHGPPSLTTLRVGETRPISRTSVSGRAIVDRTTIHLPDHQAAEAAQEYPDARRDTGIRTTIGIPLLRDGNAIGAFTVYRTESRPFSDGEITLLQSFADQAVIAIENARLFNETKEALERQTATGEILRVISSSPTDVQPVFETIAATALRLCNAKLCTVFRFDGKLIHLVALHQVSTGGGAAYRDAYPAAPGRAGGTHRAILTGSVVHIRDIREDPEYELQALARANDFGCVLSVPMLRQGLPIGAVTVGREAGRAFPDEQIKLLETFADQAVIAIENVRLFKELEARNLDLTATSEILRVISGSPTNVQPVFDGDVMHLAEARADHDEIVRPSFHARFLRSLAFSCHTMPRTWALTSGTFSARLTAARRASGSARQTRPRRSPGPRAAWPYLFPN